MEPGSKKPAVPSEDCWAIVCPQCYAQPDNPCMTEKGFFALNTHIRRKAQFQSPSADKYSRRLPASQMQERAKFQMDIADGKRPLSEFLADAHGFVITSKNRDKHTIEDEDFDPWWEEEDGEVH